MKHLLAICLLAWSATVYGAEKEAGEENPCAGMAGGDVMGVEVCEECHADKVEGMRMNAHGQAADARTPFAGNGCETCHGPASRHIDDQEGRCIVSLNGRFGESAEMRNGICLDCHNGDMMHWPGSSHESADLPCTGCHGIHTGTDAALERTTEAGVCYECHKDVRAQTFRTSTHPIRDGKVVCSDCHNPHGSVAPAGLQKTGVNETCYTCHAEKRGPFLWEHFPVTEDCTLCHKAHGSSHENMLNRQAPQLCQQCHQDISTQGARHVRRFLDYDDPDPKRGRFIVGESCMNCHSQIHGSNHPSGVNLMR